MRLTPLARFSALNSIKLTPVSRSLPRSLSVSGVIIVPSDRHSPPKRTGILPSRGSPATQSFSHITQTTRPPEQPNYMATKHLINEPDTLVVEGLKGLLRANPELSLIEHEKVVLRSPEQSKVQLLSGGGSGHEPAHAGYVGTGMLTAAVAGTIFASPSTKQILTGLRAIKSKAGTLIIVKNYTGDVLHFGLAAERAKAEGLKIEMVVVADDVAVGRQKGSLVGRRGLAGTVLVHKISGALAEKGSIPVQPKADNGRESLETVAATAKNVIENLVTIGFSLDHCSVPGRTTDEFLAANEVEIGMGIHNEPGVNRLKSIPTSSDLASKLLKLLLDKSDPDRAFVPFSPNDQTVLMVNNLGSISNLELSAFAGLVYEQLEKTYRLKPTRVYVGTFMTALNGPGVSVTLLNLSRLSDTTSVLAALDAKTTALGWSGNVTSWKRSGKLDLIASPPEEEHGKVAQVAADPATFTKILEGAAHALIKAEPEITKYDTIAGDGDCGETLVAGSNAILSALKSNSLPLFNTVSGILALAALVEDTMGGTSGALYSIYLSALAQGVAQSNESKVTVPVLAKAAEFALAALGKYTPARVGDRTLVDALDPFVQELSESHDLWKAVEAAREGAAETAKMTARLGRASYVGGESLPPDPGAVGIAALVEGIATSLQK